jgi:hypothetical protein
MSAPIDTPTALASGYDVGHKDEGEFAFVWATTPAGRAFLAAIASRLAGTRHELVVVDAERYAGPASDAWLEWLCTTAAERHLTVWAS